MKERRRGRRIHTLVMAWLFARQVNKQASKQTNKQQKQEKAHVNLKPDLGAAYFSSIYTTAKLSPSKHSSANCYHFQVHLSSFGCNLHAKTETHKHAHAHTHTPKVRRASIWETKKWKAVLAKRQLVISYNHSTNNQTRLKQQSNLIHLLRWLSSYHVI